MKFVLLQLIYGKRKKWDCYRPVRNVIAFCMFASMVSLQREIEILKILIV